MKFRRLNTDAGFEIYSITTGQKLLSVTKNVMHDEFENVDYIHYNVFDSAGNYLLEYFDANSPGYIEEVYARSGYNAYSYDNIKQTVSASYDPIAKAKFAAVTQTMNETGLPYGVAYTITDLSVIDPINNPPPAPVDIISIPLPREPYPDPVQPPLISVVPAPIEAPITTIPIDSPDTGIPTTPEPTDTYIPPPVQGDPVLPPDEGIPVIKVEPDDSTPTNVDDLPGGSTGNTTQESQPSENKISPLMVAAGLIFAFMLLKD